MSADSTSSLCAATLDPQIAIATVAILGAVSHACVAILRGLQDYRHGTNARLTRSTDLDA